METVRFFGLADLAASHYVERCDLILQTISTIDELTSVNDVITLFNLLRYDKAGLSSRWDAAAIAHTRKLVGTFGKNLDSVGISVVYAGVSPENRHDFWTLFCDLHWFDKVTSANFGSFIQTDRPNIRPLLGQKVLLKKYRETLRTHFLLDPSNAALYIESRRKSISSTGHDQIHIPEPIEPNELDSLFSRYLESSDCAYGYLEIIANMHEVSDKTKLRARRKATELSSAVFSESTGFTFGVEIKYVEQEEPVVFEFEDGISKYSYAIGWVTQNLDPPTILNNFIYLFEFIDKSGRITLVATAAEVPVMERVLNTERDDWYPAGIVFSQKNQAALIQLFSYSKILESEGIRIEAIVEWFFSDYLKEVYGIKDFQVSLPSVSTTHLEKCRIIAPEIERVFRQYALYCDDGSIDLELLAVSSRPVPVSGCPSRVANKYVYSKSEDIKRAIYYFFSDQCMLSYDASIQESSENFLARILKGPVNRDHIEGYLHRDLDWLINKGYLGQSPDGWVTIKDKGKIVLLRELYRNEVIVYWKCSQQLQEIVDNWQSTGDVYCESSLFSAAEKDYLNYHLNKVGGFINSLDLRNRYAHGSVSGANGEDNSYMQDYTQLLKVLILILLKINDDLEQREVINLRSGES